MSDLDIDFDHLWDGQGFHYSDIYIIGGFDYEIYAVNLPHEYKINWYINGDLVETGEETITFNRSEAGEYLILLEVEYYSRIYSKSVNLVIKEELMSMRIDSELIRMENDSYPVITNLLRSNGDFVLTRSNFQLLLSGDSGNTWDDISETLPVEVRLITDGVIEKRESSYYIWILADNRLFLSNISSDGIFYEVNGDMNQADRIYFSGDYLFAESSDFISYTDDNGVSFNELLEQIKSEPEAEFQSIEYSSYAYFKDSKFYLFNYSDGSNYRWESEPGKSQCYWTKTDSLADFSIKKFSAAQSMYPEYLLLYDEHSFNYENTRTRFSLSYDSGNTWEHAYYQSIGSTSFALPSLFFDKESNYYAAALGELYFGSSLETMNSIHFPYKLTEEDSDLKNVLLITGTEDFLICITYGNYVLFFDR